MVDTRSAPIPSAIFVALSAGDAVAGTAVHREQESAIRAELASRMGVAIDWPVRVMLGTPSTLIVQEAQSVDAALIVLGLRRHGRLDRVVHDETTLNVMRNATIPVLGVVAEMPRLPRRIMAAMDFSEGSLLALRAGKAVTGDEALLVLAHVQPMSGYLLDEGQARIYEMGVEAGFAKLAEQLGRRTGCTPTTSSCTTGRSRVPRRPCSSTATRWVPI